MNSLQTISLHGLCFSFPESNKPFFENLHLDFKVGQMNFVCGKNGMGKSTLLKILSGQNQYPVQGSLSVSGGSYALDTLGSHFDCIGMVAQNFHEMLVETYSFYENLQFALLPTYPSLQRLPNYAQLPAFITKYSINPLIPVAQLSGGQRQILSILMVLERSPQLLLLDEPTAALDEENARLVMQFLEELCKEKNITVVAIVHDLHVVRTYAEKYYIELYKQENGVRSARIVNNNHK